MNRVIAVTANDDFSLDLKFNDGDMKRFDARPYLDYEFFRELKDPEYFKHVTLAFGTVQWPHGQDMSPETLYLGALRFLSPPIINLTLRNSPPRLIVRQQDLLIPEL
jgi:hypothetical protein